MNISFQSWFSNYLNWNYCCSRYPANMAISSLLIFIHKRNAKSRVYTKFLWFLQWETAQHHRLQWGKFQFCGLHYSSSFTNIKTFQSPCRRASSELLMDSRKFWVITNSVSVTYPTLNCLTIFYLKIYLFKSKWWLLGLWTTWIVKFRGNQLWLFASPRSYKKVIKILLWLLHHAV